MAHLDSGVTAYVHAQALVDVYFPVDSRGNEDISCRQCYFYRGDSSNRCGLNHEVCAYPNKYVGDGCPLYRVDDDTGEIEKIIK